MSGHRHKAVEERTFAYTRPCWPCDRPDPRSHGGVTFVETCSCGAIRRTNSTGRHTETTGWIASEEES